jgi:protein lifeguard
MLGMISAYHQTQIVMTAIAITVIITLGVTIFSLQTKYDLTQWTLLAVCLCWALLGFGIACIIYRTAIMQGNLIYLLILF